MLFYTTRRVLNACAYLRAHASARMRRRAYPKHLVCRRIFKSVRRPISTHDDTIIRIVVTTLDVIIERATLGTILYRKKSFLITRRFTTLLVIRKDFLLYKIVPRVARSIITSSVATTMRMIVSSCVLIGRI